MKNTAKEVLERIEKLQNNKMAQLETIYQKALDAGNAAAEADQIMKQAAEELDLATYSKAKSDLEKANVAAEMYSKRYEQLEHKEFMSETESDNVIDSLLAYEKELAVEYEKKIVAPISTMNKIHLEYVEAVQETETAIESWCANIHANYRSEGTTYADGTNRSQSPVPVHRLPYTGCGKSKLIGSFLDKVEKSKQNTVTE